MILVDFNQVFISNLMAQLYGNKTVEVDENLVRHMVLSTILFYKKKFQDEFGDLVFCCDDRNYWRKDNFQYYKSNRKKSRDESKFDWKVIFDSLNKVRDEIRDVFPYRVVKSDRAEADDIIAVLSKYYQTNELIVEGLIEKPQPVLILSGDKDFLQLQKWDNIHQYSPMLKKYIYEDNPEDYIIEHIIRGDSIDGIPNVLSEDDALFNVDKKQVVLSKKRYNKVFEEIKKQNFDDEATRKNYLRNRQLIDLSFIPEETEKSIIEAYKTCSHGDRSQLFKYFMKNKLRLLSESIPEY